MDLDKRARKHKIRAGVKERFGGTCAYCGKKPHVLTLDHIVAKSKGGFDVRSNLVAACRRCNKSKHSRELWEWWQSSPWWDEARARQLSETVLVCRLKQQN
ncbi:HNH endonuclease [filamentous cyanobacterium LEGE 11480]|uniref:HNH endonuclease n=1 Tax=Romeriopsis navalis LEGE 11480 TaxID=2777977 RepID=A0A928Z6T7_9CYAN|nr:HNH endonuclease [Romeriopsis navalis]MBE9033332.1 HNH endonuclease [Romeriopsis navalis LEGE 11480]